MGRFDCGAGIWVSARSPLSLRIGVALSGPGTDRYWYRWAGARGERVADNGCGFAWEVWVAGGGRESDAVLLLHTSLSEVVIR